MATEFIELAGKVNQQMPPPLRGEGPSGAERPGPVGERRPRGDRGRQLQAGGGRRARVARAEDRGRGGSLPRPSRAEPHRVRAHEQPFEQALADIDLALILTAYPGVDHELIARRAGLIVDLHGVTRTANISNVMRP